MAAAVGAAVSLVPMLGGHAVAADCPGAETHNVTLWLVVARVRGRLRSYRSIRDFKSCTVLAPYNIAILDVVSPKPSFMMLTRST